jgi:hypothetical protein
VRRLDAAFDGAARRAALDSIMAAKKQMAQKPQQIHQNQQSAATQKITPSLLRSLSPFAATVFFEQL